MFSAELVTDVSWICVAGDGSVLSLPCNVAAGLHVAGTDWF